MPSDNYSKHDVEVLTKLTELGVLMTQMQKDIKENGVDNKKQLKELQDRVKTLEMWKSKVLGIMLVVGTIITTAVTLITKWLGGLIG